MATSITPLTLVASKTVLDINFHDLKKLLSVLTPIPEVTFPVRGAEMPTLFAGSWHRFPLVMAKTSTLTFDQLQFKVENGGGQVSSVKDLTFDPAKPHVVLLAGAKPGIYTLDHGN